MKIRKSLRMASRLQMGRRGVAYTRSKAGEDHYLDIHTLEKKYIFARLQCYHEKQVACDSRKEHPKSRRK